MILAYSFEKEWMKSKRVNRHVGVVGKVIPHKLFLDTRALLVCFRGETAWTIHVSKICMTGIAFSTPSWDFLNRQ